jgi:tetratricopeptide (TPR) repeat protein
MAATAEVITGRTIRVYCVTHKVGFDAQANKPLVCARGDHALAKQFPDQSVWEYCCDCQHCWLVDTAKKEPASKECPACEREIVRRYACAECNVISLESNEPARRKTFNLTGGTPAPNCPGCLQTPPAAGIKHECPDYGAHFITGFSKCPFCDQVLEAPPEFPCTVAACLSGLKSTPTQLKFDNQEGELKASANGEYVLLPIVPGVSLSLVIPNSEQLKSKRDYYETYYELFNCENPRAGEVLVVRPATVRRTETGWVVNEAGAIEIKVANPAKGEPAETGLVCANCGTPGKTSERFCGRCGVVLKTTSSRASNAAASKTSANLPIAESQNDYTSHWQPPNPSVAYIPTTEPTYDLESTSVAPTTTSSTSTGVKVVLSVVAGFFLLVVIVALSTKSIGSNSVENRLEQAINRGNLFPPAVDNAHDLYNQLKSGNASEGTLRKYRERLIPLLTSLPNQLLANLPRIAEDEPAADQWREAARNLRWVVELNPGDNKVAARAAYCEGRAAFVERQHDAALQSWNHAADLDRSWALPVNGIGLICQTRKDYETSRSYFLRAINLDPNWPHPYENLGNNYYYEKNYAAARDYYQKALEKAPDWAKPHWHLGQVAMQFNDYSTAVSELQAALSPSAKGLKGNESQLVQRDLDRAQQKLSQYSTTTNY